MEEKNVLRLECFIEKNSIFSSISWCPAYARCSRFPPMCLVYNMYLIPIVDDLQTINDLQA